MCEMNRGTTSGRISQLLAAAVSLQFSGHKREHRATFRNWFNEQIKITYKVFREKSNQSEPLRKYKQ